MSVKTFLNDELGGLLVAIAVLCGLWVFYHELRKDWADQVVINIDGTPTLQEAKYFWDGVWFYKDKLRVFSDSFIIEKNWNSIERPLNESLSTTTHQMQSLSSLFLLELKTRLPYPPYKFPHTHPDNWDPPKKFCTHFFLKYALRCPS